MGRKAWLLSNTQRGARGSAMLYNLIVTAKENMWKCNSNCNEMKDYCNSNCNAFQGDCFGFLAFCYNLIVSFLEDCLKNISLFCYNVAIFIALLQTSLQFKLYLHKTSWRFMIIWSMFWSGFRLAVLIRRRTGKRWCLGLRICRLNYGQIATSRCDLLTLTFFLPNWQLENSHNKKPRQTGIYFCISPLILLYMYTSYHR